MRRWRLINRSRRARGRARLDLEELEGREVLAPFVMAPLFVVPPDALEGVARPVPLSGESSFSVFETDPEAPLYNIVATLSGTHGTLSVGTVAGVTVTGNESGAVTLEGRIDRVDSLLQSGFTFTPDEYYSGDADIALSVTDSGAPPQTASAGFALKVLPDASPATLTWGSRDEVRLRTGPFAFRPSDAFPSGFLRVNGWPQEEDSETISVTLSLDVDDSERTGEFILSANGVRLNPYNGSPGLWELNGTNAAAFQALLDSLVLTPPADYSGRVGMFAFGSVHDAVQYRDGSTADDWEYPADAVSVRFFADAKFTVPRTFALEGSAPSTSAAGTRSPTRRRLTRTRTRSRCPCRAARWRSTPPRCPPGSWPGATGAPSS